MTTEIKVRTWLWVVLATVVVLGGGFTYWSVKGSKETAKTTTSPTPTKSATVSPSAGTTTSPTASTNKTSTPAATPTSTPPTGWKIEKDYVFAGGGKGYGAEYQLFIKDDWSSVFGGSIMWPHGLMAYASPSESQCVSAEAGMYPAAEASCLFTISTANTADAFTYALPIPSFDGHYCGITFNSQNISTADKKIITDSFKVLSKK